MATSQITDQGYNASGQKARCIILERWTEFVQHSNGIVGIEAEEVYCSPITTTPTRIPLSQCDKCGVVISVVDWIHDKCGKNYKGSSLDQLQKKMHVIGAKCDQCDGELVNPLLGYENVPCTFGGTLDGAQTEEWIEDPTLYKMPPSGTMGADMNMDPFPETEEPAQIEETPQEIRELPSPVLYFLQSTWAPALLRQGVAGTGLSQVGDVFRHGIGGGRQFVTEMCIVYFPNDVPTRTAKISNARFVTQQDQYIGSKGTVLESTDNLPFAYPDLLAQLLFHCENFLSTEVRFRELLKCETDHVERVKGQSVTVWAVEVMLPEGPLEMMKVTGHYPTPTIRGAITDGLTSISITAEVEQLMKLE